MPQVSPVQVNMPQASPIQAKTPKVPINSTYATESKLDRIPKGLDPYTMIAMQEVNIEKLNVFKEKARREKR